MNQYKEQVQDYVDGFLTPSEKQAFEAAMKADQSLRESVELYRDLVQGIELGADSELRNALGQVNAQLKSEGFFSAVETVGKTVRMQPEAKVVSFQYTRWAAAASVLLVAVIGYWMIPKIIKPSNSIDYAAQFQPEQQQLKMVYDELAATGFASDKVRNASLKIALDAYQMGDFAKAKNLFATHLNQYQQDIDAQFYQSMSLMALKDWSNAHILLEKWGQSPPNRWTQAANWYLALCYGNLPEKTARAKTLLENIATDKTSPYQAKAHSLLNQLR
ncbi:MAG: hypothetical protein RL329_2547 [Bacteroidota bacterium]|jgi:TolA-binding protein